MKSRTLLALTAVPLFAASVAAGPPVTSPDAPSPAAEVTRQWMIAALQAPLLGYFDGSTPRSEAVQMLVATQRREKLGSGVGWYGPSQRRHDWAWLAGHFDADRDGQITRQELAASGELFSRLDRNRDGSVTAEDLDWSEGSPWVRQDAQALRLFRAIDRDGDGRATDAETQAYFKRLAGGKGHLAPDDLRDALAGAEQRGKGKKVRHEKWVECLMAGDLGSPFEGPRVGQDAPDFTLATQDGKKQITLSDFRGKKPVVLIFGSFT
jgi:AhpC/TSA family/EF hand